MLLKHLHQSLHSADEIVACKKKKVMVTMETNTNKSMVLAKDTSVLGYNPRKRLAEVPEEVGDDPAAKRLKNPQKTIMFASIITVTSL